MRSHGQAQDITGLLVESDVLDSTDDVPVPVLHRVALLDRGPRALAHIGGHGILGPEERLGRDRVAEIGCRPSGRWRYEVVLFEARLGAELLLVETQRDRFSVSRCVRE